MEHVSLPLHSEQPDPGTKYTQLLIKNIQLLIKNIQALI